MLLDGLQRRRVGFLADILIRHHAAREEIPLAVDNRANPIRRRIRGSEQATKPSWIERNGYNVLYVAALENGRAERNKDLSGHQSLIRKIANDRCSAVRSTIRTGVARTGKQCAEGTRQIDELLACRVRNNDGFHTGYFAFEARGEGIETCKIAALQRLSLRHDLRGLLLGRDILVDCRGDFPHLGQCAGFHGRLLAKPDNKRDSRCE